MPELPEVECIRRALEGSIIGARVQRARLLRRDVLVAPGDPAGGFSRQRGRAAPAALGGGVGLGTVAIAPLARPVRKVDLLEGQTITAVLRRGKQLALIADDRRALMVHLGMTGQLLVLPSQEVPTMNHIHLSLRLMIDRQSPSRDLLFRDPRRFGLLRVVRAVEHHDDLWRSGVQPLGPDALEICGAELHASLSTSRRPIKAALLDQSVLAGVGNIYADESLFLAGIAPSTIASELSAARADRLAAAIQEVLTRAILAGGSTLRDYVTPDGEPGTFQLVHAVYGRAGEPCAVCGAPLRSAVLAQRSTVWCSMCQT